MNGISRSSWLRKRCVQTTAKHPGAVKRSQQKAPNHKRVLKKRDIRTSFLRTPVAPVLNPPPAAPQQPAAAAAPSVLPPAIPLQADSATAALQAAPLVTISLGETCNTTTTATASSTSSSSRLAGEPVVASLAVAVDAPAATDSLLGLSTSSSSASSSHDEDTLWGSQDGLNSLAALDRALNGLILAPAGTSSTSSKASSSTAKTSSSSSNSKSNSKSSSKRSSSSSGSTAAAGPALLSIHCENDWERELAAAAANQQLVVVKVEAAQSLMRSSSCIDPTLRFQTHNILPTELNTYAPHTDLLSSFSLLGNSGPAAPATFTSAYDFSPASMRASSGSAVVAAAVASSSPACQLDSPVHHWYRQLAGQYASGGSGSSSRQLRFLSLQSDAPRAKALCRRLGVAAPLSVLLVEPGSGRQVMQVVGKKVEQELPSALLYFGDVDAQGAAPSQLLPQLSSKEQLDAHTSSADVSVVAFHMHAAPPCVQSYSRLFEAAQGSAGSVPFAVMDVDSSEECTALSNDLGLQRLPTYFVYKNGQEVHRLARSSERKQLSELLQQLSGGAAAEKAVVAAA